MARVTVVVPTFNGEAYLKACLTSLRASTLGDFHVIVVDDGSDTPVASMVHEHFPQANVIRNDLNVGLTRGFNAAIRAATTEFIVLLNDDTEVEPTWLESLVACADRHPDAGSIASKLRLAQDRTTLHSAGDTYSVRGMPGNRGVWIEDFGQYDSEEPVFGACAGAALYRRSALEAVALPTGDVFDTRLFMYCEDVDLSWRLQNAGFACIFAPEAVVYHHLSATGGGNLASYYVSRNLWYVLAHSVPRRLWRDFRFRILAYHLGRMFRVLPHLREPAARKQLAGTASGVVYFLRHRTSAPDLEVSRYQSILPLLEDS